MKTAIYLNEGTTQLVLTPTNEWERNILRMVHESLPDKTFWGKFYECQGGWVREAPAFYGGYGNPEPLNDSSLIVRIDKQAPVKDIIA